MGGNNMSALYDPIKARDVDRLKQVLHRYGSAVPLLLQKQFVAGSQNCCEMDPVFTTPLKFCIACKEADCLRALLHAGGDPNERGKGGATLLHKACKSVTVDCVKVLLEYGARVYDSDEWGVYPIHCCVGAYGDFEGSLAILTSLLEAGSSDDINLKDGEYEKSPLHYAAFYGNKKICARLLDLGADINAKDKHGRTAYQSSERHKKIQDFLKEKGCDIPESIKKKALPPLFPSSNNNANTNGNNDTNSPAVAANSAETAACNDTQSNINSHTQTNKDHKLHQPQAWSESQTTNNSVSLSQNVGSGEKAP